jgi:hypothetical protein
MKRKQQLLMVTCFILSSIACSFSDKLRNIRVIDMVIGDDSENVDYTPEDIVQEFTDDPVSFSCKPVSLEPYLGENWKFAPTDLTDLILDMKAIGDTLEYSISFSSSSKFLVERDPDYWPPPGATLVPEGEYDFVEIYRGSGSAQLEGDIFTGSLKVDYENTMYYPEPEKTVGSLEFPTLAKVNLGDIEICFQVLPDQFDATAKDPGKLLYPNCRWPGYIFTCTAFR